MDAKVRLILAGVAIVVAASACNDGTGDGDGGSEAGLSKEVFVAHFQAPCVGVGPRQCLMVRESAEDDWAMRYDPIDGFEYETGYDYRLMISETTDSDPPADASAIRWTLIEVLEKIPVATDGAGGKPMFRAWKLEAFGSAADLGDEAAAALIKGALAALPTDGPVTLDLSEEGRAGGFDGCNRYFGDFRIENGHEIVQGPKGATLMACPGGAMELEQAFLRNLEGATRAFLQGDRLELHNDDGVVLVFASRESGA